MVPPAGALSSSFLNDPERRRERMHLHRQFAAFFIVLALAAFFIVLALAGCAQGSMGQAGAPNAPNSPGNNEIRPEHGGGDGGGGGGGM
jgi:hypothetical protein